MIRLGPEKMEAALGCMVPHAGYMYSGHVAGAVFQRLPARATYIILCPNHTGRGAPLAIDVKRRVADAAGRRAALTRNWPRACSIPATC